jgi:hypothetical protein
MQKTANAVCPPAPRGLPADTDFRHHNHGGQQKTIPLVSFIALFVCTFSASSCTSPEDIDRQDYGKLKIAMLRISRQPDDLMGGELDRLKNLELRSKKVSRIRDDCYLAYHKVLLASGKSKEAGAVIQNIEKAVSENASAEVILEMKQEAESLLSESNKLLDDAGGLKDKCHGQMEEMENPRKK